MLLMRTPTAKHCQSGVYCLCCATALDMCRGNQRSAAKQNTDELLTTSLLCSTTVEGDHGVAGISIATSKTLLRCGGNQISWPGEM